MYLIFNHYISIKLYCDWPILLIWPTLSPNSPRII